MDTPKRSGFPDWWENFIQSRDFNDQARLLIVPVFKFARLSAPSRPESSGNGARLVHPNPWIAKGGKECLWHGPRSCQAASGSTLPTTNPPLPSTRSRGSPNGYTSLRNRREDTRSALGVATGHCSSTKLSDHIHKRSCS